MRLNRVESFYAFLLRFRSEGSPCKRQPGMAMASPLAGVAGHLQGGGRLRPGPLQGATTRRGSCPRRGRKGQPHCQCCRPRAAAPPPAQGSGGDDGAKG
ncbi:hypothetical protein GW17_00058180 [Ensete ventricosum]|nr:hypothetical protein GW17_00058180 [Ensete ventricosum]